MDHIHADGATRALDAIRAGGEHLIVQVRQRMSTTLDALDEGDFVKCANYLADALQSVQALSQAQQFIAIAEGTRLILAADVEVGMTVTNVGEVTDMTVEPCVNERCRRHINLKIGEHELTFRGDQEVYVDLTAMTEPDERE